jgi:DNA-binding NtrC family response regulator
MLNSIVILESQSLDCEALARAFRVEAGASCDVRIVRAVNELIRILSDANRQHLAVIPQDFGDAKQSAAKVVRRIGRMAQEVRTPVVVVAEAGNVDAAAQAAQAGANDFLVLGERLPERIATLLGKMRGLFEVIDRNRQLDARNAQLREAIETRFEIVGQSPPMRRLMAQIPRLAKIPRPVLIVGERGTGKELFARAIHLAAGPDARPLVTVNCAAFTDALLESELFGHERGAFTGAETTRLGKFEQADGGTLFLDEIGHMSLPFQQKILRVVEYGAFTRVGGVTERKTNTRIIAATNCDLRERIQRGSFLPDLYDRLAFEVLVAPPLRQRPGDIELLASHFLNQFTREIPAFRGKTLSDEAIATLKRYSFPGNVRELKNIIERAAYHDATNEITPNDMEMLIDDDLISGSGSFEEKMNLFGRRLILDALKHAGGNQAAAARILGLSYHQFRYFNKKLAPLG